MTGLAELKEFLVNTAEVSPGFLKKFKPGKHQGVYLLSCLKNRYLFSDLKFEQLSGYAPSELSKMDADFWMLRIHPEDKAVLMEKIIEAHHRPGNAKDQTNVLSLEYRFKHTNGQWIWLRETKFALSGSADSMDLVLGTIEDIRAQRQAREDRIQDLLQDENCNRLLKSAVDYVDTQKKKVLNNSLTEGVADQPQGVAQLTKREKEILQLVAEGLSTKQISQRLFISHHTVETHRQHLLKKLKVKNSMELVKQASKAFWL